jgi:hypothetical protein
LEACREVKSGGSDEVRWGKRMECKCNKEGGGGLDGGIGGGPDIDAVGEGDGSSFAERRSGGGTERVVGGGGADCGGRG